MIFFNQLLTTIRPPHLLRLHLRLHPRNQPFHLLINILRQSSLITLDQFREYLQKTESAPPSHNTKSSQQNISKNVLVSVTLTLSSRTSALTRKTLSLFLIQESTLYYHVAKLPHFPNIRRTAIPYLDQLNTAKSGITTLFMAMGKPSVASTMPSSLWIARADRKRLLDSKT